MERSECLFCMFYKVFGGEMCQSVCFVCGIRCEGECGVRVSLLGVVIDMLGSEASDCLFSTF